MPDIAPVVPIGVDLTTCLLHGGCPIADGGMPAQAARLGFPQHQGPGVGVDWQRAFGGPDRPTVEVDDIEIGTAAPATIDFVQGQGARRRRGMRCHPVQGALFGLLVLMALMVPSEMCWPVVALKQA